MRTCSWARSNCFQPSRVFCCMCTEAVAGLGMNRGLRNRLGGLCTYLLDVHHEPALAWCASGFAAGPKSQHIFRPPGTWAMGCPGPILITNPAPFWLAVQGTCHGDHNHMASPRDATWYPICPLALVQAQALILWRYTNKTAGLAETLLLGEFR